MITLKNKLRRMRAFNLDAPFFVKRHGETLYGRPETLTLLALERRVDLPDALLACTEIKTAIGQGNLRVYKQAEPAPAPEPETVEESQPVPEPEPEPEMPPLPDLEPDEELLELNRAEPAEETVPEAGPDAEDAGDELGPGGWERELESETEPEDED